jgi:hypothetical protein
MRTTSLKNIILIGGLAGILLSCSTQRHFQRESVNTAGLYGDTTTTDSATIANKPWRELFTETNLQQLFRKD